MLIELAANKRWNGIGNFLQLSVPQAADKIWFEDYIVRPLASYMSKFEIILNSKDKNIALNIVDYPDIGQNNYP